MYRIRNSIVHRWKNDFKFIESITATLEKYYLEILEDILDHFTNRNGFSLDDYFLRTEKTYENYISEIKSEQFKTDEIITRWERLTDPKIIF